jgi:hypothetical protein
LPGPRNKSAEESPTGEVPELAIIAAARSKTALAVPDSPVTTLTHQWMP